MEERLVARERRMEGLENRLGKMPEKLDSIEEKLDCLLDSLAEIRVQLAKKPTTAALSCMIPTALWAMLAIAALMYIVAGHVGRAAVL